MNVQPMKDYVIIKPISEETTHGGIIMTADSLKAISGSRLSHGEALKAKVIAVGPGRYVNNTRIPLEMSVGDTVVYHNHDIYNKYKDDEGIELSIINSKHIIAVIG